MQFDLKFEEQGSWEGWLLTWKGNGRHGEINMNYYPEDLEKLQLWTKGSDSWIDLAYEIWDDAMAPIHAREEADEMARVYAEGMNNE